VSQKPGGVRGFRRFGDGDVKAQNFSLAQGRAALAKWRECSLSREGDTPPSGSRLRRQRHLHDLPASRALAGESPMTGAFSGARRRAALSPYTTSWDLTERYGRADDGDAREECVALTD